MCRGSLRKPEPTAIVPGILRARVTSLVLRSSIPKALLSPPPGVSAHKPLRRNQPLFAGKSQAKEEFMCNYSVIAIKSLPQSLG